MLVRRFSLKMANSMITQVGRDGEQTQAPGYRKKKGFFASICCCFAKEEEDDGREMAIVGQNVRIFSFFLSTLPFFFFGLSFLVGDSNWDHPDS